MTDTTLLFRRLLLRTKRAVNAVIGPIAVCFLKALRLANVDRSADLAAAFMRRVGPWLPEHKIGRANLAAAFPEKSAAEIEVILRGAWDNLARVGAEMAHLDRLWDYDAARPEQGRIEYSAKDMALFARLRDDGKPALIFSAHLGNWELAALAATALGLDTGVLYRRPNIGAIADAIIGLRAGRMGTLIPTGLDAPFKIATALQRGQHVAMLVDQYYVRGVEVTFFGRRTMTNPLIARLARHFDCPLHGVRVIRLPGRRFRVDLSEAIAPARNSQGEIDVQGTMQVITSVIEGWVREYPEQWLWQHRRWRPEDFIGRSSPASKAG